MENYNNWQTAVCRVSRFSDVWCYVRYFGILWVYSQTNVSAQCRRIEQVGSIGKAIKRCYLPVTSNPSLTSKQHTEPVTSNTLHSATHQPASILQCTVVQCFITLIADTISRRDSNLISLWEKRGMLSTQRRGRGGGAVWKLSV